MPSHQAILIVSLVAALPGGLVGLERKRVEQALDAAGLLRGGDGVREVAL